MAFSVRALLCLGFLILAACSEKPQPAEDEGEPATPVKVALAKKGTIQETVSVEAVLYPIRQADVTPKVSAPVQRFLVQRGAHVKEGQLLAVLENRDLVAATTESQSLYEQAQAAYETTTAATLPEDLVKASTDLQSAQANADAAKKVYESRENLYRQGAIAQRLVEDARVTLVQAQSQLDVAQKHLNTLDSIGKVQQIKSADAQLQAAKAHVSSANAQLSYTEIRSPLSGIVADRPANVGDVAGAGSALMSIVDIHEIVARANVPVEQASHIRVGRPATISTFGKEVPGKVSVVSPAVSPHTTTVEVWVQAENPDEALKPGATAQITIQVADVADAVIVPKSALLSNDEGGEKVMVAGVDSRAREQDVKVGVRDADDVQILEGVKPGDHVITEGGLGLEDKAKIKTGEGEDEKGTGAGEK